MYLELFGYIVLYLSVDLLLRKYQSKTQDINFIIFWFVLLFSCVVIGIYDMFNLQLDNDLVINKVLLVVVGILATTHIFILSFDSKKIFNKSIAEYYSSEMDSIVAIYAPMVTYLVYVVASGNNIFILNNVIGLHLLLYYLYMFIQILDDVQTWNKNVVKPKYIKHTSKQIDNIAVIIDEITVSNFLINIDEFGIENITPKSIDALLTDRLGKIKYYYIRDKVSAEKFDEIALYYFNKIIEQFLVENRTEVVDIDAALYFLRVLIHKLDNYTVDNLLVNPYFKFKNVDETQIVSIMLSRWFETLEAEDMGSAIKFNVDYKKQSIINSRNNVDQDKLKQIFYLEMYECAINITKYAPKEINDNSDLKELVIIESIIEWNNRMQESELSPKERRVNIPKIGVLNKINNIYFDFEYENNFELDEVFELKEELNELSYHITHSLDLRHRYGMWSGPRTATLNSISNLVRKVLKNKLHEIDQNQQFDTNEAHELNEFVYWYAREFNSMDDEEFNKDFNEIIRLKKVLIVKFYNIIPAIIENYKVTNGIFDEPNRKMIRNILQAKKVYTTKLFRSDEINSDHEVYKGIKKLIKYLKNSDNPYIEVPSRIEGESIVYTKLSIYNYIYKEFPIILKYDKEEKIISYLKEQNEFYTVIGMRSIEKDEAYTLISSYFEFSTNSYFIRGYSDAIENKLKLYGENAKKKLDLKLIEAIKEFKTINLKKVDIPLYEMPIIFSKIQAWPATSQLYLDFAYELIYRHYFQQLSYSGINYSDIITGETKSDATLRLLKKSTEILVAGEHKKCTLIKSVYEIYKYDEEINKDIAKHIKEIVDIVFANNSKENLYKLKTLYDRNAYTYLEEEFKQSFELDALFKFEIEEMIE